MFQFEDTRPRNMSSPAFPLIGHPSITPQQQQQQVPGDRHLERTTEVENIPQQLSVQPPQRNVLTTQRSAVYMFHTSDIP